MKTAAVRKILIILESVILTASCTVVEVTQSPIKTPTKHASSAVMPTSFSEVRSDCASRYPSAPVDRETWPTGDWKVSSLEEHCLESAKVEKAAWYFEQNYSTSSLLIVRHGELVYEKYFLSPNKLEHRVPIYSITKSFLSALVGIALDQGRLDSLNHKVIEYFPEYFYPDTDPRMKEVKLRDLLTMSGGFVWLEDGEIEERWMESGNLVEASINLKFQDMPGEGFNYSNANTQLLSAILTEIVDEPLRDYAQSSLFSPLGIKPKDWSWGVDDQGYYLGGWGMNFRPRDIARFGYLYLNEGYWDGKQVVSRDWVLQSTSKQIEAHPGMNYGYLWWVHPGEAPSIFEAIGYGGQSLYVIPSLDLVVVVTGNVDRGDAGAPNPAPIIYEWIVKAVADK
jgi:CubicO group peptidase (beta-lactamase class C family)